MKSTGTSATKVFPPGNNPEFTMMELYTTYWDYTKTMDLCEDIYKYVCQKALGTTVVEYNGNTYDFSKPWQRLTVLESIHKYTGTGIPMERRPGISASKSRHRTGNPQSHGNRG